MHPNPHFRANPLLPWPPPQSGQGLESTRHIPFKVWDLKKIQSAAATVLDGTAKGQVLRPVTRKCIEDVAKESLQEIDIAELVISLDDEVHYINSVWCEMSKPEGTKAPDEYFWLPCDAYSIKTRRQNELGIWQAEYYLKMCLSPSGAVVLFVSIHG